MKTAKYTAILLAIMVIVFSNTGYAQQQGSSGQRGWYGGPMMMGWGHHMGWQSSGPGGWYCPWFGGGPRYGSNGQNPYNDRGEALTKNQAQQMLKDRIRGNSNLKIGELADKGDFYETTIVTNKEGALVEKIQIDKKTGWFRNVQ
ncbi:MAG: hypothetical protein PHS57_04170 [Alphaproteobacteria bacterium]|nr:hypothetical protein [Alphaproteobacteria bacterium]